METKVKMTIEITVDDEATMERFGKTADKTTMGEYRELLLEALEEASFQVDKVGLIQFLNMGFVKEVLYGYSCDEKDVVAKSNQDIATNSRNSDRGDDNDQGL